MKHNLKAFLTISIISTSSAFAAEHINETSGVGRQTQETERQASQSRSSVDWQSFFRAKELIMQKKQVEALEVLLTLCTEKDPCLVRAAAVFLLAKKDEVVKVRLGQIVKDTVSANTVGAIADAFYVNGIRDQAFRALTLAQFKTENDESKLYNKRESEMLLARMYRQSKAEQAAENSVLGEGNTQLEAMLSGKD